MTLRRNAFLGVAAVIALGCGDDSPTIPRTELLARYVALGNSITAGFQSAGINDSTQRRSYAALLAQQGGVGYAYASLGAGCPAPITSLLGGLSGGINPTCTVSGQTPGRKRLNNVAVPGADSFDPTETVPSLDDLTTLILDGKNQVDKALEEPPSFVSIWIGNNDVLSSAIGGVLEATPKVVFEENYARMVNQLVAGGVTEGVLIGVADVTEIPLLVPASALGDPTLRLALNFVAGRTVTVEAGCNGSASLISLAIVPAIAAGSHAPSIDCVKTSDDDPVGERFIVDVAEQNALVAAVAEYNAYIGAKADSVGFSYYDPNPLFAQARARGEIPAVPDLSNAAAPFGPLFSFDGVHPSTHGHVLIANDLIAFINAEYGTQMRLVRE